MLNHPAVLTRPNLLNALSILAQKCSNPTADDMRRVKRIFRYINGTKDLGLTFKPGDGKITHYLCIPMLLWNIQKVTLRNPIN